jgi:hypothetical protein
MLDGGTSKKSGTVSRGQQSTGAGTDPDKTDHLVSSPDQGGDRGPADGSGGTQHADPLAPEARAVWRPGCGMRVHGCQIPRQERAFDEHFGF